VGSRAREAATAVARVFGSRVVVVVGLQTSTWARVASSS